MKTKNLLIISLILTISSCDLFNQLTGTNPTNNNTVVQNFIDDFDRGLSTSSSLDQTQRSDLKVSVLINAEDFIKSEDLTDIIPEVVGLYIQGLVDFDIDNTSRLNAIEAISITSI